MEIQVKITITIPEAGMILIIMMLLRIMVEITTIEIMIEVEVKSIITTTSIIIKVTITLTLGEEGDTLIEGGLLTAEEGMVHFDHTEVEDEDPFHQDILVIGSFMKMLMVPWLNQEVLHIDHQRNTFEEEDAETSGAGEEDFKTTLRHIRTIAMNRSSIAITTDKPFIGIFHTLKN